jgi:hypothetical protein
MFDRIRKLLLVVCITVLIWVWADQALTRETIVSATIAVDKSTDSQLLVRLNLQPTVSARLRLSGPASKIDAVERRLKEGQLRLELYINPTEEKITNPGDYTLKLLPLIERSRMIADLGLQIESTEPETINVNVIQLVRQKLTVQVLSDNQIPLKDAAVEPATVEMPVRKDWVGDMLKATVTLTPQEIEQARTAGITRRPSVELAPGVIRTADTEVKITLPSTKQRLKEFVIDGVNIGYTFSPNLAGKFKVELLNQNQVLSPIRIQATDEAALAYKNVPFKVILDISDDDAKATGDLSRTVVFNLPADYVRKGEISVAEAEPRIAKFKLVPIEAPQNGATPP